MARYGEDQAHSFQPRLYPNGFRYRDWLVRAFNRDMPYDQFVLEQIAGDLLDGPDRLARLAALGFFACGPVYYGDAKKHDQYADRIDTLTRGFLGLTVACTAATTTSTTRSRQPITMHLPVFSPAPNTWKSRRRRRNKSTRTTRRRPRSRPRTRRSPSFLKAEAERLKQKVSGDQLKQVEHMLPAEAKSKLKA